MALESGYDGDEALTALLSAAGGETNINSVRALIDGVNGAAPADDSWMSLVTPRLDDKLRTQLDALRNEMAAAGTVDFSIRPDRQRLLQLRQQLADMGLHGFLIPRTDEHQGEFVAPRAERLRWLTGFSGSAGLAIVLADTAAIFVDGRYTLQVRQQADETVFSPHHLIESPPDKWIAETLPKGGRLGYDPWLHSQSAAERFAKAAEKAGGELVPVEANPIDAVWGNQPAAPIAPIHTHDLVFAGKSAADKRREIADLLSEDGVDAAVLTQPDSIAWLLNVRGGDVQHTPLPQSYAILFRDSTVEWFVDHRKLVTGLTEELGNEIAVQPVNALGEKLVELGASKAKVVVDPATASAYVFERLDGADIRRKEDPCTLPKAIKNDAEISGARAAHLRDGKALTKFLQWFAAAAPEGDLNEIDAAERLRAFRAEAGDLRDLSFPTISSTGPNGAVVHYHATPETNRTIGDGELYLVDSGAQYPDGTTDVTRTIAVGRPTLEMKDRFTRVLKGHIAIATARFPEGTTGAQLDTLARSALWQAGLDFDHGTGHGVGSYLGVHEGPHRISKGGGGVALKPGMVVSNEPGYYKAEEYGIRIENLVVVTRCNHLEDAERTTFEFETLTLAPIDLNLVEKSLMTEAEIEWLNAYHARVRRELGDGLSEVEQDWLDTATRAI